MGMEMEMEIPWGSKIRDGMVIQRSREAAKSAMGS
jgi:hypothetical protein